MPRTKRTIKFLTEAELRQLLKAITNPRDKALVYTAYRHGLRASEVGMLTYGDWDQAANRLSITRLKGSLSGVQPMDQYEVKFLKSYLRTTNGHLTPTTPLFTSRRGLPIARRTLQDLIRKYAAKAGIPREKAFFHVLKHSIATHLLNGGADIMVVREWLGHKRIDNTLIYAQLSSPKRDQDVQRALTKVRVV